MREPTPRHHKWCLYQCLTTCLWLQTGGRATAVNPGGGATSRPWSVCCSRSEQRTHTTAAEVSPGDAAAPACGVGVGGGSWSSTTGPVKTIKALYLWENLNVVMFIHGIDNLVFILRIIRANTLFEWVGIVSWTCYEHEGVFANGYYCHEVSFCK